MYAAGLLDGISDGKPSTEESTKNSGFMAQLPNHLPFPANSTQRRPTSTRSGSGSPLRSRLKK